MNEYENKQDYIEDWDLHQDYIKNFDPLEAMLMGYVWDSVSGRADKSKITDSYATTLAKERADRVMGRLPEGITEGSKSDQGKAALMDIIRTKYVYKNANAQHPFFEKLNLWQLYSSVYGYMPMFYDWNVSNTGYVGPDCWLWNPRNLVPQQGRISIHDMDYLHAFTWVSHKFLQNILDKENKDDGWDRQAIRELIERAKNEKKDSDPHTDTVGQRTRVGQATREGIKIATRYEAGEEGKWVSFAPDHGYLVLRDISNPHKNGRIPFVIKYSQPLFDSFYGLGDFQRAKPLQFARDGLTNFYFRGIKMNLLPPLVANANGVVKHTLDYREGAVMLETLPNSIRRLETSTAGLNTYQAAQSNLTGSLLSLYGTQNASIPGAESLNPSQGKTPAAIRNYSEKEETRDNAERRHLENAIEELTDGFFSLIVNIGTEEMSITMFEKDIEEIQETGMEDVMDMVQVSPTNQGVYSLKIKPEALKGVEYRFNIEPNSTMKVNKQEQLDNLERTLGMLGKFQNVFQEDRRVDINWGQIMKVHSTLSEVKGGDQFITINDAPSPAEEAMMEQNQQLQEAVQELTETVEQQQFQIEQLKGPDPNSLVNYENPEIEQVANEIMQ